MDNNYVAMRRLSALHISIPIRIDMPLGLNRRGYICPLGGGEGAGRWDCDVLASTSISISTGNGH